LNLRRLRSWKKKLPEIGGRLCVRKKKNVSRGGGCEGTRSQVGERKSGQKNFSSMAEKKYNNIETTDRAFEGCVDFSSTKVPRRKILLPKPEEHRVLKRRGLKINGGYARSQGVEALLRQLLEILRRSNACEYRRGPTVSVIDCLCERGENV